MTSASIQQSLLRLRNSFTLGRSLDNPIIIALFLLVFGAIWLLHLSSVELTPPADNIEQLIWMHSLEWGYYKHPPLPTWLMSFVVHWVGWNKWSSYLLGAFCTLTSFGLYWSILREIRGPRFAFLALIAALCITFYSGRTNYYNHNVVMMLCISLSAWLWWRIQTRPRLWWWFLLGMVAACGMLSKYQYALILVPMLYLYCRYRLWKQRIHQIGLACAMGIGTALFLPHIIWLLTTKGGPLQYAMHSSLGVNLGPVARVQLTAQWILDWCLNRCLPAVVLLAIVRYCGGLAVFVPQRPGTSEEIGIAILRAWGLFPIASMALICLLFGVELQLQWGTAFALWSVPLFIDAFRINESRLGGGRPVFVTIAAFVLMQGGLLFQSYATSPYGSHPSRPAHWRQFPSQALADAIGTPARQLIGGPIRVISGPPGAAGAIALWMPEHPLILVDGKIVLSPWISPQELSTEPVLELWAPGSGPEDVNRVQNEWGWRVRLPKAQLNDSGAPI